MSKTIEEMYGESLKKEPQKFDPRIKKRYGYEWKTKEWIRWNVEHERIKGCHEIGPAARNEILRVFKSGKSIGETGAILGIDSEIVGNVIFFNINKVLILNEDSI